MVCRTSRLFLSKLSQAEMAKVGQDLLLSHLMMDKTIQSQALMGLFNSSSSSQLIKLICSLCLSVDSMVFREHFNLRLSISDPCLVMIKFWKWFVDRWLIGEMKETLLPPVQWLKTWKSLRSKRTNIAKRLLMVALSTLAAQFALKTWQRKQFSYHAHICTAWTASNLGFNNTISALSADMNWQLMMLTMKPRGNSNRINRHDWWL